MDPAEIHHILCFAMDSAGIRHKILLLLVWEFSV